MFLHVFVQPRECAFMRKHTLLFVVVFFADLERPKSLCAEIHMFLYAFEADVLREHLFLCVFETRSGQSGERPGSKWQTLNRYIHI